MAKLLEHIDDDTLAMLKKIDEHDNIYQVEVDTAYGTFRLEHDDATDTSRWTFDISNLIRAEVVA